VRETSKATKRRFSNLHEAAFWSSLFEGAGLDIGAGDDLLIIPNVQGFDIQHGDANVIDQYVSREFDFVHASQCLEHMRDPVSALASWFKVLKPNGYMCVTVPSWELYEGKVWPSRFNSDHKSVFSLWSSTSTAPIHVKLPEWLFSHFPQHTVVMCRLVDTHYNYITGASIDQTLYYDDGVEAFIEIVMRKAN
jgi:SAM-dependent methyltransferase